MIWRPIIRLSSVVIATGVCAVLWVHGVLVNPVKAGVVWQVGLGLFAALLTALTIVFAVTTSTQTRWPSFNDLVRAIGLNSWLLAAIVGILLAAIGDILANALFTTLGAVYSLLQLGLGMDTLLSLLRFRTASGRESVLTRLTTGRLHRAATGEKLVVATQGHLSELLDEVESAIDRRDVAELANRAIEVVKGWPQDRSASQARWRLALITHLLERLGRSVLFESLNGDVARAAIPPLLEGALRTSWQLSALTFPKRIDKRDEVVAAVALGQICRVIGWLQQCAHARLQRNPHDPGARQIVNAVGEGRLRIVQYVDPDPPGFYRTPQDPWPYGFSDSAAALLWLTAMCEFGASHVGSGLYILCEILTGEKFYGNYWNGDCVFSEIEKRVGRDLRVRAELEPILRGCGDLAFISLELAAIVIAGLRDRRYVPPEGRDNDANYSVDPRYLRSQVTMFATYDCLDDADAAFDWMTEALTNAPTRPSLTGYALGAFSRHSSPNQLPMVPLAARPASVTLAAVLRLAMNRRRAAHTLISRLPDPLLTGALQHARYVFTDKGDGEPRVLRWHSDVDSVLGSRRRRQSELIGILDELLDV
ncbi:hypothetical protein [Sphaerisporangium rhizosphaerae]|uniref:DUF2254 domain-containing protein n=1 Tax=Sphaerisporangium rhizosphaerae TaxID=2269375 RepID=A0ABW2PBT2_9ACTN